ncbi:hypothetical protein H171_4842 [[Clostridium] celerecrescens 18A]|uniref:Uncharacterized protein n=1 Tax=[Clostridium] celerecrescens 18A TaxID=1286362 RepID=A0A2M8ZCL0_9FIRM|nr:hypothetical protein H171_4842 [[Clostridium] celerecrescens 18A]
MTHLGSRIPALRNSMPGNLHDRLFLTMDNSRNVALQRPGRIKSNTQRNRFTWPGPGNLISKSSRIISSDCIYIGME